MRTKKRFLCSWGITAAALLCVASVQTASAQHHQLPDQLLLDGKTFAALQQSNNAVVLASYSAKYVCGTKTVPPEAFDLLKGKYATKINVHNSTGCDLQYRKKLIYFQTAGQVPHQPIIIDHGELEEDWGMEMTCEDIVGYIESSGGIVVNLEDQVVEGYIILQVYRRFGSPFCFSLNFRTWDPFDVTSVHTYRDDEQVLPGGGVGVGASIDVEYVEQRNNIHGINVP